MDNTTTENLKNSIQVDAIIIGAGFSGLYMTHKLNEIGLKIKTFESADTVGGVWYWNRYPGARADVESIEYSYSFSKELQDDWNWTERYAAQPEILSYLNYVADRFDLRKHIQFRTRVISATFNDSTRRWNVITDKEDDISAQYCIMATGVLSSFNVPKIKGLDTFKGQTLLTGEWPHKEIGFTGKRVGVVGTGPSGIQCVPVIAEQASHLYIFQRTPNFAAPAWNKKLDSEYLKSVKEKYSQIRHDARICKFGVSHQPNPNPMSHYSQKERQEMMEKYWKMGGLLFLTLFSDLLINKETNDTVAAFVREKIRQTVKDPRTAELLMPRGYPLGSKRLCVGTKYWQAFNRENVTLVDLNTTPIDEIIPEGIKTAKEIFELDYIVLATGFDAITGSLAKIDIRGRNGIRLNEKWADGPRTYLGLMTAGFPNLFIITGPGSPSVLTNMVTSIEHHVEWIGDCINYMKKNSIKLIEPLRSAEDEWVDHVKSVAEKTLFSKTNSWYVGTNVPGKPRVFMPYAGGHGNYRKKCDEIVKNGYEGFTLIKENN